MPTGTSSRPFCGWRTCRAYRFVREFATEVMRERTLSLKLDLPLETFDVLLAAKAEWNERLATITPMTRAKLRHILFRIMREASIISDDHRILAPKRLTPPPIPPRKSKPPRPGPVPWSLLLTGASLDQARQPQGTVRAPL